MHRNMITYHRPHFWQRTWFTLACMAVAAAAVIAWWMLQGRWAAAAPGTAAAQGGGSGQPAQSASGGPLSTSGAQAGLRSELAPAQILADGRPSDFSPQEWAALKEAMSQAEQPEAELRRVVDYLRFQKRFERWQGLRDSPDVGLRRQIAAGLIDQVPERLRQGEVSMGEAQMLLAALWTDLEPDESRRRQRIEEGGKLLQAAAPKPDAEQEKRDAAMLAEYKRREAAIVLEYQSRGEGQRDPAWLEAQLDAARRAVYGGN